jgi:hypothetical protein
LLIYIGEQATSRLSIPCKQLAMSSDAMMKGRSNECRCNAGRKESSGRETAAPLMFVLSVGCSGGAVPKDGNRQPTAFWQQAIDFKELTPGNYLGVRRY